MPDKFLIISLVIVITSQLREILLDELPLYYLASLSL